MTRPLLWAFLAQPASIRQIAYRFCVTRQAAHWMLQKLLADGSVREHSRDGQYVTYCATKQPPRPARTCKPKPVKQRPVKPGNGTGKIALEVFWK